MLKKLKDLIAGQLDIDGESVSETSNLVQDLGADSLDIVQMLILLEKEFGVEFEEEEIKNIKTVGDVVNYIKLKQK